MQLSALRHKGFRRFWLASLASVGATQLLAVGLGWLVFRLTGSALDLGLLGVAIAAPTIAVTLIGSVLADRLDRRLVIIVASGAIALLLLALAGLDASGVVTFEQVIAVAVTFGLLAGFDWPARQAIFPSLVDQEHMMSAVALNSILWQGARMLMPAIGGVLISLAGTAVVFLICALGFFVMCVVLARLDTRTGAAALTGGGLAEGVRFIFSDRLFAVLIGLSWVIGFFGMSYIQIMPVFADRLGVAERGFGLLVSATGVGAVAGTLVVGVLQQLARPGRLMLAAMLGAALGLVAFGAVIASVDRLPDPFVLALGCAFATNACVSVFLICAMTELQLRVPERLRGRVMGMHGITFSLLALGGIFGGAIASAFGPAAAVIAGAVVIVLAAGWVMLTQPEIRELNSLYS